MLLRDRSVRSQLRSWWDKVRGPVGPWARRLVGALSAPDLVGQSSWARGPVGPWLVGARRGAGVGVPELVGPWARGPKVRKKKSPAAPGLSFSIWYLVSSI